MAARASVIVPTTGSRPLGHVLGPLLEDEATAEVLVVVDGGAAVHLNGDGRVRLVHMPAGQRGDSAARQVGLEAAREDLVVFLDDDVIPRPGLVSGHAARHDASTHRLVLGYMPIELPHIRTPADLPAALYDEGYTYMCEAYERDPAQVLHNFWAGNFSVRRDDAVRIGIGDAAFADLYHSDRNFGLRSLAAGLEPVFDRSLAARHEYRRSWSQFCDDGRRQGAGRLRLHVKHERVLGRLGLDVYELGLSSGARRLLRLARRPRALEVMRPVLYAVAAVSCAARRPEAALWAARLVRSMEQQRGALDEARKTFA
jgi:glycosyltransferase involved in cell wall biosynthesis